MYKIIDGKIISGSVKDRVAKEVAELKQKGITTGLAVIIVGEDPLLKYMLQIRKRLARLWVLFRKNTPCLKTQPKKSFSILLTS